MIKWIILIFVYYYGRIHIQLFWGRSRYVNPCIYVDKNINIQNYSRRAQRVLLHLISHCNYLVSPFIIIVVGGGIRMGGNEGSCRPLMYSPMENTYFVYILYPACVAHSNVETLDQIVYDTVSNTIKYNMLYCTYKYVQESSRPFFPPKKRGGVPQ